MKCDGLHPILSFIFPEDTFSCTDRFAYASCHLFAQCHLCIGHSAYPGPAGFHNDYPLFLDVFACLTGVINALIAWPLKHHLVVLAISFPQLLYCLGATASNDEIGYEEMRWDLLLPKAPDAIHDLLQATSALAALLMPGVAVFLCLLVLYNAARKHFRRKPAPTTSTTLRHR